MKKPRPVRVATRPKRVSPPAQGCKLGELFHVLGESYVLDILHTALTAETPRRFVDLQRALGMSPNTLTDRLRRLVDAGLLTRQAYNQIPPRVEYAPTPKAREFQTMFRGLEEWAGRHNLEPMSAATV